MAPNDTLLRRGCLALTVYKCWHIVLTFLILVISAELTKKIEHCKETEATNSKKVKEIEAKMKDAKGHREKQLKEAEAEMKRLKKVADNSRKQWKQREQDYETLKLEISELTKGLETTGAQLTSTDENIVKLSEQLGETKERLSEIKVRLNSIGCPMTMVK